MYEIKYVKKKPARNLEWVDGCHALLYDTYMCKDIENILKDRQRDENRNIFLSFIYNKLYDMRYILKR